MQKSFQNKLFRLLRIEEVENPSIAFEILVDSLAVISRASRIDDLEEFICKANFTPFNRLMQSSDADLELLDGVIRKRRVKLEEEDIHQDQVKVQKLINRSSRKKIAAYFTKPIGLKFMETVTSEYAKSCNSPITLCDPFLGSGLTLTAALGKLNHFQVREVWGIEPHPLCALVAYAAILDTLEGDFHKVNIRVDDAFAVAYRLLYPRSNDNNETPRIRSLKADVILTNPPFTRWELLSKEYRVFLRKVIEVLGYGKYIRRAQLNLQLVSLFLMDHILADGGLLISILPASTFYTIYGEAAKRLLVEKYRMNAMVENDSEPSFSVDSGFKELILVAEKGLAGTETAFVTLTESEEDFRSFKCIFDGNKSTDDDVNWVNIDKVSRLWETNWLALFRHNKLRAILAEVLSKAIDCGAVDTWISCLGKKCIVRGIEMYGPDFFLVPNKYWNIDHEDAEAAVLEDINGRQLEIPKELLVSALRKPELYKRTIEPQIDHYFMAVPPRPLSQLPKDVMEYIRWGEASLAAKPAIRAFGKMWYSHVYKQISTKKPFGRMFLPDKIDLSFRGRGVFALFSEKLVTASKNFYVVTLDDKLRDEVLTAWFNSSIFIAYFIVAGRQIGRNWTRFLEDDYLKMPVINIGSLEEDDLTRIRKNIKYIKNVELPPLRHQLGCDFRCKLDMTLLETLEIHRPSDIVSRLYSALKDHRYSS